MAEKRVSLLGQKMQLQWGGGLPTILDYQCGYGD